MTFHLVLDRICMMGFIKIWWCQLAPKNGVQELLQASLPSQCLILPLQERVYIVSLFCYTPMSFALCISGEAFLIHKFLSRDKNKALAPGRLLSAENLAPSVWGKLRSLPGGKYLIVLPPSKMTLKPSGLSMAIDIHDGPVTSWVLQFPWLNHNFWKQIPAFTSLSGFVEGNTSF